MPRKNNKPNTKDEGGSFGPTAKEIVRAITFSDFYAHKPKYLKSLNILKI